MKKHFRFAIFDLRLLVGVMLMLSAPVAMAAQEGAPPRGERGLTVAVLNFEARTPGQPDLGAEIGQMLTILLSSEAGLTMVDRASLERTLQEIELGMTGLVSDNDAVRVGRLVGARIMVTGRAFVMGENMFITAKLIGTETSLVSGVLVRGEAGEDVGQMVMSLAEQMGNRLREVGPELVGGENPMEDPLPGLREALTGRRLPVVAVVVREEHIRPQPVVRVAPVPDPAVETEIKRLLGEAGVTVRDIGQNELAEWAQRWRPGQAIPWPQELAGVDVVIVGEGFSEFGARIGNLVSCLARAEINVISRRDGRVILSDRETTRAVDLSENIAGKTALEQAGYKLGVRILEHLAETLPEAEETEENDE